VWIAPLALLLTGGEIAWQFAPAVISLPGAPMRLPKGVIYVEGSELQRFLKATGNPPDGSEKLVFGPVDLAWFAVVSYRPGADPEARVWTSESVEPDGRHTTNLFVWRPVDGGRLELELVSDPAHFAAHRAVFEAILGGNRADPPPALRWPYLAAALLLLAILWRAFRR
jgi:uncharacterized membrane-anchored protein